MIVSIINLSCRFIKIKNRISNTVMAAVWVLSNSDLLELSQLPIENLPRKDFLNAIALS